MQNTPISSQFWLKRFWKSTKSHNLKGKKRWCFFLFEKILKPKQQHSSVLPWFKLNGYDVCETYTSKHDIRFSFISNHFLIRKVISSTGQSTSTCSWLYGYRVNYMSYNSIVIFFFFLLYFHSSSYSYAIVFFVFAVLIYYYLSLCFSLSLLDGDHKCVSISFFFF